MLHPMSWIPQATQDGSFTFFSEEFGEAFHSSKGARAEALNKFAQATDLAVKASRGHLCLLDVCYGLGYNTAAALETIWRVNPDCRVTAYGLELDATVPLAAIAPPVLAGWSPRVQEVLRHLAQSHGCSGDGLEAKLLIGDARQTMQALAGQSIQADGIFFDPFSPRRCPQLWTVDFFKVVAQCFAPDGKLATYSRSAAVRSAMIAAGLQVGTIPLPPGVYRSHEWSQGTVAAMTGEGLHPLSPMEQEHLHTRAAVPYRDPDLQAEAAEILQRHERDQQHCRLELTSRWRSRWGIY